MPSAAAPGENRRGSLSETQAAEGISSGHHRSSLAEEFKSGQEKVRQKKVTNQENGAKSQTKKTATGGDHNMGRFSG